MSSKFYPWHIPSWCHLSSTTFISTFNIVSSLPLILPNLYTWCPQQNTGGLPTPVFHTVSNKYERLKIKSHVDCTHTTGNITRVKGNRSTPMMAKERPMSCRENPSPPAGRCHSWWYRFSIIMVTMILWSYSEQLCDTNCEEFCVTNLRSEQLCQRFKFCLMMT